MHFRRGQAIAEYTVIVIIVLAVIITMKDLIKRSLQSNWKNSADNVGHQFDPQWINANNGRASQSNTMSIVTVAGCEATGNMYTDRTDQANYWEDKTVNSQVGT
jgi:Flp pilus assembly pilin Flp